MQNLTSQQLDALYSYGYNVGMGNLKKRVLPSLQAYVNGQATAKDVAKKMTATRDSELRGLRRRRTWERNLFAGEGNDLHVTLANAGESIQRPIQISFEPQGNPFSKWQLPQASVPAFMWQDNSTYLTSYPKQAVPEKNLQSDNGLGLFSLMQSSGLLEDPGQKTFMSYRQPEERAMFVGSTPAQESTDSSILAFMPNNTYPAMPLFAEGGYLFGKGGVKDSDNPPTDRDPYTTLDYAGPGEYYFDKEGYAHTIRGTVGPIVLPDINVTTKANGTGLKDNEGGFYNTSADNYSRLYGDKVGNDIGKVMLGTLALGTAPITLPEIASATTAMGNGLSDALMATKFGQTVGNGLNLVSKSPATKYLNWFLTSAGLTDAANDVRTGNVDLNTIAEALPAVQVFKPLTYSLKGAANTAKNLYDEGALWDRYTTLGGRFGNYSDNPFVNVYATTARRFGLPDKPRIPADAMRKLKFENGEIIPITNGKVTLTGGRTTAGKPHMNSTTDRQVTRHPNGGWDGRDGYLFSTQDFVNQTLPSGSLKSIEPSDMFANGVDVSMPADKITLISGDAGALKAAREAGMQTLSSPRLRRMYNSKWNEYQANRFLNKKPKDIKIWQPYADEINRLMGTRGTPTLADYKLLEQETGLNAGVTPISEYQRAIDSLNKMLHAPIDDVTNGVVKHYVYPNGRAVDWDKNSIEEELELIKRAKYNNVFYDPATWAEHNWKMANGIKDK